MSIIELILNDNEGHDIIHHSTKKPYIYYFAYCIQLSVGVCIVQFQTLWLR